MLALAGLRAGWLGVVKADALRKAAATQQTAQVTVPAAAARSPTATGSSAVSQPATTVAATPYLVKDPRSPPSSPSRCGTAEDKLLRQLTRRDTGFAYLARRVPAIKARRVERMKIEGLEFIPEARRTYPRDFLASQLLGNVGAEGKGLSGSTRSTARCAAATVSAGSSRTRSARRSSCARRAHQAGRQRHADRRRGDPGQGRAGASRGRRDVAPARRHRDRHGPARRRAAGACELAASTPTTPATPPTTHARTARSAPPTSPARRSRRSLSPARSRRRRSRRRPSSACRRRSSSTTA